MVFWQTVIVSVRPPTFIAWCVFVVSFLRENANLCLMSWLKVWSWYATGYTKFCRINGCGGAGCPLHPPIIFERLKLPQQMIYRWKGTLSESPNHFKYRKNILNSLFYEQFSRSSRILSHCWKYEQLSNCVITWPWSIFYSWTDILPVTAASSWPRHKGP